MAVTQRLVHTAIDRARRGIRDLAAVLADDGLDRDAPDAVAIADELVSLGEDMTALAARLEEITGRLDGG